MSDISNHSTQHKNLGLQVHGLTLRHGKQVLLRDVTFSLGEGESCIIVGPNGCGKTTLLRAALGLHLNYSGELRNSFRVRGYVPQARNLDLAFPISVRRSIEMSFPGATALFHSGRRRALRASVDEALEYVGIAPIADLLLRECSGGQLQKALIARALVHRPQLLVLDEPTNSLDESGKADLMTLLRKFQSDGASILMTTHDKDVARDPIFLTELTIANQTASKRSRSEATNV